MALEMKAACQQCGGPLLHEGPAYICSYECSFCAPCAEGKLARVCPNCGGELVPRPRRRAKPD